MRRLIYTAAALLLSCVCVFAQADKRDVRAGNRKFKKEHFKEAEIDYRKAVLKDTLSVPAAYNLASSLYKQEDWDGAGKALEQVKELAPAGPHAADWHYNSGDVALQKKDYAGAVKAFREALLLRPDDLDAKENYIYAKKMLENQQNGGGGGGDQNQDQNDDQQNQNQDQQQDQQDQNQDQQQQDQDDQQNQDQQDQQQEQKISPQQAQQMLKAIQAKEKETQDKVKKEKAEALKARQKDKNW